MILNWTPVWTHFLIIKYPRQNSGTVPVTEYKDETLHLGNKLRAEPFCAHVLCWFPGTCNPQFHNSPLSKRVETWDKNGHALSYEIIWGDKVEYKCAYSPKLSHNWMHAHCCPRFPLSLKVGYSEHMLGFWMSTAHLQIEYPMQGVNTAPFCASAQEWVPGHRVWTLPSIVHQYNNP